MAGAGIFGGLGVLAAAYWIFLLLPAGMAESRGRSRIGWAVSSLLFSPLLACFLLALLGDSTHEKSKA